MTRSELKTYRFVMPSKLELVEGLREEFEIYLKELDLPEGAIHFWLLILSEVAVNAIEHGNQNDPEKDFEIRWSLDGQTICLESRDHGSGPPQQLVEEPTLPDDPLSDGGRGLYLIQQFADTWEHWKAPDGYWTRVLKHHEEISDMAGFDPVLEQALNELTTCYENLSAFYRLGEGLIRAENVGHFITTALTDLANVASHDFIALQFCEAYQESLSNELDVLGVVRKEPLSEKQQQVVDSGLEYIWETLEEVDGDTCLSSYACGICAPIKAGNKVQGILTAARTSNDPYFNAGELNTIRTFGDLVGIAVVSANNTLARSREARALRELEIASEMQNNLLPMPKTTSGDGWLAFARRKGAREVAGDHVEVAINGKGELYLVCIDVMGKGVSAAFLAAIFRTAFYLSLTIDESVEALTRRLNSVLIHQMGGLTMFATCAIARINAARDEAEIVNAGHCPVILMDAKGDIIQVDPSGPPLGLFEGIELKTETFPIGNEATMLMVTDGLYEWEIGGDIWGWDPFVEFFVESADAKPEVFWNRLQNLIHSKADDPTTSSDDQTMLYWKACS